MRAAVAGICLPLAMAAQSLTLTVRSEFLRVDPGGAILAQDATPQPRELLSPAVVRNAYASFLVVVETPRVNYFLFAGSNPENVFRVAMYRAEFSQHGEDWIPDVLKPVELPHFGVIPDPESLAPRQSARVYLMDVWVPADAPVGRTRLEVQVKAGTWTVWPMEVRILPPVVPMDRPRSAVPLPDPRLRADESATAPLVEFVERHGQGPAEAAQSPAAGAPRTLREAIRRNAEQDMALARTLNAEEAVVALKAKMAGAGGGEWYLGVRDWIYRAAAR